MPQFAAGLIRLESGNLGSSSMIALQGVNNVKVEYSIPRADVGVVNRGKPLHERPVINYTPGEASFEFYHRDTQILQMLGLINASNIITNITDTRGTTATVGVRSAQVLFAPTNSTSYNGLLDLKSGVLTSLSLQGSVNDPVRGSISLQFLNISGSVNTTSRDTSNYAASLVKPENISLTGISFTGCGLTGVTVQSFAFSVGFSRAGVQQLGQRFPIERPLTDVRASVQVQGFFEGINNSFTGLEMFQCGAPQDTTVSIGMVPACVSPAAAGTINVYRPYIDSFGVDAQPGGFTTFSLSMSAPIGPNPTETGDGSVVTIT